MRQIFSESFSDQSIKYKVLKLIDEGISNNVVKPFNANKYSAEEVNQAIELMSSDNKIEKIILEVRPEIMKESNKQLMNELVVSAVHNTQFLRDRTYIIVGGLGGFGLELSQWLVERGAQHLVLTSRSGIKNYFQEFTINRIRKLGANVVLSELDVSDRQQCHQLIEESNRMSPIDGIFCLSMVFKRCSIREPDN